MQDCQTPFLREAETSTSLHSNGCRILERFTPSLQSLSLPPVKKLDTLAQLTKILAEANTKIDELTRARDKWHNLYWEVQQEIAVLRTQTWPLCDECTTVKDETPEGKTFERCFRCTPDADKTRLLEIAETEAR